MKKNPGMVFPARGKLSKILFVVRLKFFLILFSCFQLNAAVHSQNNVRISLDLENVSLEQVIWEIQKKTDFVFMYGTRDIEGVKQLTVQETDKEVNEILKTCLKNTGLWKSRETFTAVYALLERSARQWAQALNAEQV